MLEMAYRDALMTDIYHIKLIFFISYFQDETEKH